MSAADVVQRQLDAYDAQNLEAFCACFVADCVIADLNGAVTHSGIDAIRARYADLFARYPDNGARLVNRIAVGPVVVAHENFARSADERFQAIAIYTVRDGWIARVDFARGEGDANAAIVQSQIDAYNAQDVDKMCAFYAEDCVFWELNGEVCQHGREAIKSRYAQTFSEFPQNWARSANRIALGAYVIDDEQGERAPGVDPFRIAAIYTVRDGLIARCDFAR